jgi:hypothetical protein
LEGDNDVGGDVRPRLGGPLLKKIPGGNFEERCGVRLAVRPSNRKEEFEHHSGSFQRE